MDKFKPHNMITSGCKINISNHWDRTVIQNAPDGFLLIEYPGGDILDANDSFCNMLDYSHEELLSMNIRDIEIGFDGKSETIQRKISDIEETGEVSLETRHRCKNGEIIDVAVNLRYLEKGLSFCFHRDITEQKRKEKTEQANRKQAEAALRESEDRYRTLIELGNKIGEAVIMLQDIDGREGMHTYISSQWPQITGYSKKELLGMSFFDLVSKNDRDLSIKRHRQKMSGKTISDLFELTIIRKDNKSVPIEVTSAVTSYRSKQTNVVYIRDITERKKVERELCIEREGYKELFDYNPIATIEYDASELKDYIDELSRQGVSDFTEYFRSNPDKAIYAISKEHIIRMNRCAESLLGGNITQVKENIKALVNAETPNQNRFNVEIFSDFIIRLLLGQKSLSSELPIITLSGHKKYVLQQISIMPGYEDTWGKVITADIDITERKKIEHELAIYRNHLEDMVKERTLEIEKAKSKLEELYKSERKLRQQLEKQTKQRVVFTRALVHELKTPLTPILCAAEELTSNLQEEPYASYAKSIHYGSKQLGQRVDELLDVAKGEIGILKLNCRDINLLDLLKEISEYMSLEATKRKQKVNCKFPSSVKTIYADSERLKQITLNLLANAFRFTPEGGLISLIVRKNKNSMLFQVTDNGIGMDEKVKQKLFQPYETARSDTTGLGGLGIGLSLCKMLVELHKGEIKVISKKNQGTRVAFTIPHSYTK